MLASRASAPRTTSKRMGDLLTVDLLKSYLQNHIELLLYQQWGEERLQMCSSY